MAGERQSFHEPSGGASGVEMSSQQPLVKNRKRRASLLTGRKSAVAPRRARGQTNLKHALPAPDWRYRTVFENVPIGVCWATADGQLLQCNRILRKLTGYSAAEISRMHLRELIQDAAETLQPPGKAQREGDSFQADGRLLRKDGTFALTRLTSSRLTFDGQELLLLTAVDITPGKRAEAELRKTEQALEQTELALKQKSIALAEVVNQVEAGKHRLKEDIAANIREFVLPILKKLRLTPAPIEYLDLLEQNLHKVTGQFGIKISEVAPSLSPRETEITEMIACGLTSKQIAQLLNICSETVEKHRREIRRKIGISGKKINLASFLHGNS